MNESRLLQLARSDRIVHRLILARWIVWAIVILFLISGLATGELGSERKIFFGLFLILLPQGIIIDIYRFFLRSEVGRAEAAEAKRHDGLTYATALLFARASQDSAHLWYRLLNDQGVQFVLVRLGLKPPEVYHLLTQYPDYSAWLTAARQMANNQKQPLRPEHLFEVLQSNEPFTTLWQNLGITATERNDVWRWWYRLEEEQKAASRGTIDSLRFAGGIGRDWTSGYTQALESYAVDLTRELKKYRNSITLIGHDDERKKLLEYLSRSQEHNVLLIGEEGIGKQRILYALASDFNEGSVPMALKYKHLYLLDVGRVISGANQNEVEMRLHQIFEEAGHVGNVIMVIPDFQLLVGAQGNKTLGMINASAVIGPYLRSPSLQVIGTINPPAYYTFIKANAQLEPYLLPVEVKEIGAREAMRILEDEVWRYENRAHKLFTYQALLKIVELAERHIHDKPYPEKVLSLVDEVAGAAGNLPQNVILPAEVEQIIGTKLKIPIGTATDAERDMLNNLESLIQNHIVGQHEAVGVVANALRRARAGLHSGRRPIGSFLFLGPTGVGKTEMAKTIAAIYYKDPKAFIRLDMSEYQTPDAVDKLLGTREQAGLLSTAVQDQPFSVVLLDEIEKAAVPVRNLFLQILDDGFVTDGFGQKVDFTNSMVIATSNAGAQLIREAVNQGRVDATFKQQLLDSLQAQGIFSPEWLNRFDAVVTFLPLTEDEIRQIAKEQVEELIVRLKGNNIELTLTDDVYDVLVARGYDPQFGARPMRRAVQDIIESALAKTLLNDTTTGVKNIQLTRAMLTG